jgi:electron transfer flavoprotein alpha subunit
LAQGNPGALAKALVAAADKIGAQIVVMSHTTTGNAVAPLVAARLRAGIVSRVTALPDTANGFVVTKTVYSGKARAYYAIRSDKKVLTLNPNSVGVSEGSTTAAVETFDPGLSDSDFRVKTTAVEKAEGGKIPLQEAERVVSGGRGMKGPENWGLIEQLAEALGAATACSRPVADAHWRPHEEHVGQTGGTIRPNLYVAIGISGAIQHLAGVNQSKTIVVINKDPEAPFFKAADYGIVGDAFEIVPKLVEAAKKLRSAN